MLPLTPHTLKTFFKTTLSLTLSRPLSLQRHLIAVRRSVVIKKAPNTICAKGLYNITFVKKSHQDKPLPFGGHQ